MSELVITRGLPASGKSTWAKKWVALDEESRARVNRDDLREMLYGRPAPLPWELEKRITVAQQTQVEALLRAGTSVVVDDTNLRLKFARAWADLAVKVGADFRVVDFNTPVEICVDRDAMRALDGGRRVGADVIRGMAEQFPRRLEVTPTAKVTPAVELYEPDLRLPSAWIVDIDGTLALMRDRSPYEWHRVGEDALNEAVAEMVATLGDSGYDIILLSGRDSCCRDETLEWLWDHNIYFTDLFMRPAGDQRRDDFVKAELFNEHVRHKYNVRGVLDDRNQVVKLWRSMGLACFQVAEGDF